MRRRVTRIVVDWMHVLGRVLPAAAVLAALDVAFVAVLVRASQRAAGQFITATVRDLAWDLVFSVAAAVLASLGLVLGRTIVPGFRRLNDESLALMGALVLAGPMCVVGIHHHLEVGMAPATERLVWFSVFGVLFAAIAWLGLRARGPGWRRIASHPVFVVAVLAPAPLFLGVTAEQVKQPRAEQPQRSSALPGTGSPAARHPDAIVLITLDTTRFDAVGYSGSGRTRTPVLDRLAAEGAAFVQATTPVPLTLPSHTSMMTGLSPRGHGVVVNGMRIPRDVPVLAEELRAHGWQTAAFVSAPVVEAGTGLSRGFDTYDDTLTSTWLPSKALATARIVRRLGWLQPRDRSGAEVTRRAVDWIERCDDHPAFLWVHYFDSHWPYLPDDASACAHAEKLARLTPEQRSRFEAADGTPAWFVEHMHELYEREVEQVDGYLGTLLDALERRGWLDSSLLIAVADHGESFRGASMFSHGDLTEATTHIPLIVRWPGEVPAGIRPAVLASVQDVNATILEAAGLGRALAGEDSIGLVNQLRDSEAEGTRAFTVHEFYTHPMASSGEGLRAARTADSKLVVASENSREEFFHLDEASSEDRNRIEDTDRTAALAALRSAIESGEDSTAASRRAELMDDAETLEMLRNLGYLK